MYTCASVREWLKETRCTRLSGLVGLCLGSKNILNKIFNKRVSFSINEQKTRFFFIKKKPLKLIMNFVRMKKKKKKKKKNKKKQKKKNKKKTKKNTSRFDSSKPGNVTGNLERVCVYIARELQNAESKIIIIFPSASARNSGCVKKETTVTLKRSAPVSALRKWKEKTTGEGKEIIKEKDKAYARTALRTYLWCHCFLNSSLLYVYPFKKKTHTHASACVYRSTIIFFFLSIICYIVGVRLRHCAYSHLSFSNLFPPLAEAKALHYVYNLVTRCSGMSYVWV